MARKTIFQKLHDAEACHAVCIAQHPLGFKDAFIVMMRTDVNKLNLYGFENSENNAYIMEWMANTVFTELIRWGFVPNKKK